MFVLLLLACCVGGAFLYFVILRPIARFFLPLTQRVPTGREYRATLSHR